MKRWRPTSLNSHSMILMALRGSSSRISDCARPRSTSSNRRRQIMLKVLFFASLRETLGVAQDSVELPVPATVAALINALRARGAEWAQALAADRRWRVAVNQDMATLDTPLSAG